MQANNRPFPKIVQSAVPTRNLELYKVWVGCISRCYNKADVAYPKYGGIGVTVCPRWRRPDTGFANFVKDMAPRPKNHWLLRHRKDRSYCKSNCYWLSQTEINKRRWKAKKRAALTDRAGATP